MQFEIVEEEDSAPLEEIVESLETVVCLCTLVCVYPSITMDFGCESTE